MAKKNYNGVEFDDSVDYAALMDKAAAAGNNEKAAVLEKKRNAKIQSGGMDSVRAVPAEGGHAV